MPRCRSSSPPQTAAPPAAHPPASSSAAESSGGSAERGVVIHRVVKEICGGGSYPTLTKTNYSDWAALMRVMLQARGLWVVVSVCTADFVEDRMALEAISKAVPAEMMGTIAGKESAKVAWDAIKTMHIGVERVRKAKASTLRREFDLLTFRDGETDDEFGMQITGIANQLMVLGDTYSEESIVRKFLQAVPSRFMENSRQEHLAALKQYVAGTMDYGLVYMRGDDEHKLVGYSDSDLGGDMDDRKSTSGIIFFLGNSPVTWQSQKQRVVALSSCEAEYIAGATAAFQGVWLRQVLGDVIGASIPSPQLMMDNMSAIALSKNPVLHNRSKHTKFHYIHGCVEKGMISLEFTSTHEQLSDILTKPLGRIKFQELRERIGVNKLK